MNTTPGQGLAPLYDNERINACINDVLASQPNHTPRGLVRRVSYMVRDDYENERASLTERIRELWAMLERRQRCEECGGSGAVPDWISDEDGGYPTNEPCECWSDAEAVVEKYRKEYGND